MPVRLIVRRVKPTPGSQLALFATYSYHGFITDRDGELLELEAEHRRHAEIENAIRGLKYAGRLQSWRGRFTKISREERWEVCGLWRRRNLCSSAWLDFTQNLEKT